MIFSIAALSLVLAAATSGSNAESHTVILENNCVIQGTPTLVQGNDVLSTGGNFVSNGPLVEAIAYFQTGNCGFNGEGCTVVQTTLINPTSSGSASSTNLTINPPYEFSVSTGFGYFDGCDGAGADCDRNACGPPFESGVGPMDGFFAVSCSANNVNLAIIFCSE